MASGSWKAVERLPTSGELDRSAVDAILKLKLDEDSAPDDAKQLLRALQTAQAALRGEKARAIAAEKSGGDDAELSRLREQLRQVEEELVETKDERDELAEEVADWEKKNRAGQAVRSRTTGSSGQTNADQRAKIEALEQDNRELRIRNKDLMRESGRKDEIIESRSAALEEQRQTMQTEREERKMLEEDVRVMRSQLRDYKDKLANTNEGVMAREERNREGKKQLQKKTREINRLLDENATLERTIKEKEEEEEALALQLEQMRIEKSQAEAEGERARIVASLERQVAAGEATEQALNRKIEELQAEMDEEEEQNEEERREMERQIADLQGAGGARAHGGGARREDREPAGGHRTACRGA